MLINNETKNETMLTSIVGMERCDMVLQLAKLIRNAKTASKENSYSSVLLIDNSFSQELYNMVSIGDSGVADYRGITIINNVGYSPKEFIKYDHILIYHGLRVEPVLLMESDHIYVITNYEKNLKTCFHASCSHLADPLSRLCHTARQSR
ncbi:MAG: hypothetical protein IKB01_14910 [Lachnospiraceae bacterium]|nr:hypothetical protein [Lachnospiraceae bacterium]